ncbi:hypothetical protein ACPCVL_31255 [Streptomyces koyangensis]|uniref:hypothetical protein n=1 Tax=Streptomyces koyangensis TaxID=188770 RepID=UPI003C2D7559
MQEWQLNTACRSELDVVTEKVTEQILEVEVERDQLASGRGQPCFALHRSDGADEGVDLQDDRQGFAEVAG